MGENTLIFEITSDDRVIFLLILLQSNITICQDSQKQNTDLLIIHYIKDSWKSVQVTQS
jgi:hypothetical protein